MGGLLCKFERAYQEPVDKDLAHRVYDYASWRLVGSKNQDIETTALFHFYEHLPLNKTIRKDMANHLTREDFFGLKEIFKYHLEEGEEEDPERSF